MELIFKTLLSLLGTGQSGKDIAGHQANSQFQGLLNFLVSNTALFLVLHCYYILGMMLTRISVVISLAPSGGESPPAVCVSDHMHVYIIMFCVFHNA